MSIVADRIRERLAKLGWSQAELARRTGIAANSIARYCAGTFEPGAETLRTLCRVMRVKADWLLGLGNRDILR